MVAIYSFAGGIRASLWTDVAQAIVMIIAMGALTTVCHFQVISLSDLYMALESINPQLITWTPHDASLGLFAYAMGWFLAGFGDRATSHDYKSNDN